MTVDKTLEYFIIRNLQYQNELTYWIYLITKKSNIQRRNANFWRIVEIPTIILALTNLFIISL